MNDTDLDATDASFDDKLNAARAITQYHYVQDDDMSARVLPYEHTMLDDPQIETLAWAMWDLRPVFHAAHKSEDLDDADGAAPRGPRTERTFLFDAQFDADDEAEADLSFEVVAAFENSYNDNRVAVETPAPWDVPDDHEGDAPNDIVKALPWGDDEADDEDEDPAHYTFESDDRAAPPEARNEAWVLDEAALPALKEAAVENGYSWVEADGDADDDAADAQDPEARTLTDLLEYVAEGDRVTVHYAKKNGNGTNAYAGVAVNHSRVHRTRSTGYDMVTGEGWGMVFEDDDGHTKRVQLDDAGQAGLFSNGHYPFMGEVLHVTVEPASPEWPDVGVDEDRPRW